LSKLFGKTPTAIEPEEKKKEPEEKEADTKAVTP